MEPAGQDGVQCLLGLPKLIIKSGTFDRKVVALLYQIEMSSKNPRFIRKIYSSDQLRSLKQEELF